MGMTGSGRIYTLPNDDCWTHLGLQASARSTAGAVRFTANLSVVNAEAWAAAYRESPWIGERPKPNVFARHGGRFQQRIGQVLGVGDRWWEVPADGGDSAAVCEDFLRVIADAGLPTLRRETAARSGA